MKEEGVPHDPATCGAAREAILEAAPTTLRSWLTGEGAWGPHLTGCGRCRRAAGAVLEGEAALGRALAGLGPRRSAEDILAGIDSVHAPTTVGRGGRLARRWWLLVPAAAAAVLAVVLLDGPERDPPATATHVTDARSGRAETAEERVEFSIEAPPEGRLVVVETSDPRMRVVWHLRSD